VIIGVEDEAKAFSLKYGRQSWPRALKAIYLPQIRPAIRPMILAKSPHVFI
jgi:hypothetical protein